MASQTPEQIKTEQELIAYFTRKKAERDAQKATQNAAHKPTPPQKTVEEQNLEIAQKRWLPPVQLKTDHP